MVNWPNVVIMASLALLFFAHFTCRVLLGLGPWLSQSDAERTVMNQIAGLWDANPWVDIPLLVGALTAAWKCKPKA
jgi:cytochrome bd-type quinol oxidase subunit 2